MVWEYWLVFYILNNFLSQWLGQLWQPKVALVRFKFTSSVHEHVSGLVWTISTSPNWTTKGELSVNKLLKFRW